MRLMQLRRKTWSSSNLQPEGLFIRTLQGPPPNNHVKLEESTGRYIVCSQAFRPSTNDGCVSGDLSQIIEADGLPATALYPTVERALGAAAVPVRVIRGLGCDVEHSPEPDNWYHGGLTGIGTDKRSRIKRAIAAASFEIVPIDQDEARRQDEAIKAENERIRAAEAG